MKSLREKIISNICINVKYIFIDSQKNLKVNNYEIINNTAWKWVKKNRRILSLTDLITKMFKQSFLV